MPTTRMDAKRDAVPDGSQGRYWDFVRAEGLILLASYAALVLGSGVVLTAYAPIMGWFGLTYLVAAAIALCGLGLIAKRGSRVLTEGKSFAWLAIVGALGVALSGLYALTFGAAASDSPTSLVVNGHLIHSAIFYITALLVGAVWHIWRWRKATK